MVKKTHKFFLSIYHHLLEKKKILINSHNQDFEEIMRSSDQELCVSISSIKPYVKRIFQKRWSNVSLKCENSLFIQMKDLLSPLILYSLFLSQLYKINRGTSLAVQRLRPSVSAAQRSGEEPIWSLLSLVGELRPHMTCSTTKKTKQKTKVAHVFTKPSSHPFLHTPIRPPNRSHSQGDVSSEL